MVLVLDASVILKFVRTENEEDQHTALAILKDFQEGAIDIIMPGFWIFEVGNTLVRKEEEFENLYQFLLDARFATYNFTSDELVGIGRFAKKNKVSFYDASYHFLAKLTNSVFVTADSKYFAKTKEAGSIVLLKDLKLPL
jgi:predicted nucleic acid-binding protein